MMKKLKWFLITCILVVLVSAGCAGKSSITVTDAAEITETQAETAKVPETMTHSETTTALETADNSESLRDVSSFEVHFIDVGQAESQLIICDGEAMLIDGGGPSSSDLIYTYLKDRGIDHLKYIVATHHDDDHVGGLAGALNYASADVAYCSSLENSDSSIFTKFIKYIGDAQLSVPTAGTEITLGSAKGVFSGPVNNSPEANNNSLMIRIEYGETSFLFTGDAMESEESDVLQSGAVLASTVLKVGHHGSNTSTTREFLEAVNPEYAVISCGAANSYHFPADAVLRRLNELGIKLYRTDLQGTIICRSDGRNVSFEAEKNPDIDTYLTYDELNPPETDADAPEKSDGGEVSGEHGDQEFILNQNIDSHKIHIPTCEAVGKMSEKNKLIVYAASLEEVLELYPDYSPCQICCGKR